MGFDTWKGGCSSGGCGCDNNIVVVVAAAAAAAAENYHQVQQNL